MKISSTFITSEDFLHLGHFFSDQEGTTLLFSGGNYNSSKTSYLCLFPKEKVVIQLSRNVNPWEDLKKHISSVGHSNDLPAWVGYLSYEMGAYSDSEIVLESHLPSIPLAIFYKPSVILKYNHLKKTLQCFSEIQFSIKDFLYKRKEPQCQFPVKIIKSESANEYIAKVKIAKEHIANGNIYQVNLSHQTLFEGSFCPFSYFEHVSLRNPTPFSAFINCRDFQILSASPERFLRKKGNHLTTTPIKGTHPRGNTEIEDLQYLSLLKNSEKERAELLMITDLMRNDLGKVSIPGSVKVPKLYELDSYKNVFHLSSTITSQVSSHSHPLDIIRAAFPGGSISGCPKIKALEIIYRLEKRPRNIYTGAIGYLTNRGNFDFNIAIRTALYQNNRLDIQLGAGIVYDSEPMNEFKETLFKGATFLGTLHADNRSHFAIPY